ncbi:MAG: TetR/AcrR family transcriptional regulator [Eubacterium sp.]|nr:TetR/AcrR family transcriptional regulator [Eubacterium sp.]
MEHKDSKKNLIIKKAAEYFYEYGYVRSTLRDITSACGVTHPTIYKHFKGKDALAQLFLKNYFSNCNEAVSKMAENCSLSDRYIYFWLIHFSVIYHDKRFARYFYEYLDTSPESFMTLEMENTINATRDLLSLDTFMNQLDLNLELINSCGAKLGEYCMNEKIDEFQAAIYMLRIMNTLNNNVFSISPEDISNFTQTHPEAVLYTRYDMVKDELGV